MSDSRIERRIGVLADRDPITFAYAHDHSSPEQFTLHLNDCVEIYVFVSGSVHYAVEDRYYTLERGDVLIIPPHTVHVPILKEPCDYERYYLLFPVTTFRGYRFDPLGAWIDGGKRHGYRLSLPEETRETLLSLLARIRTLSSEGSDDAALLAAHGLCLGLPHLFGSRDDRDDPAETVGAPIPTLLREVLRYTTESAATIGGAGEIAERFHVSLPYLSTLFRTHVGVTLSAYLRTKKLALAKQLLREGHSVTYTCYECGFSDTSYFIKVFRECVGVTPNRYRAQDGGDAADPPR